MATSSTLADVNNRIAAPGENFPVVKLADGSKIQTGTIGALMQNIKLYDRICAGEEIEGMSKSELEPMMELAIPVLLKSGMLDLFPAEEWLASKSEGRQYMGKKLSEKGH